MRVRPRALARTRSGRQRALGIAEAVHGLAEQRHLARPRGDEPRYLLDDGTRRAIALRAARVGHDAERAALVAPLHHGHELARLGASRGTGLKELRLLDVEHRAHPGRATELHVGQEARQLRNVVWAEDEIDIGHASEQAFALLL